VTGLEHVQIKDPFIGHLFPARLVGVHGGRAVERIGLSDVAGHLGPFRPTRFPANDPDRGIGAVARDQVPPVPLEAPDPSHLHGVAVRSTPAADNRRHQARIDQVLESAVGVLEVGGVHPGEVPGQVRLAAFVLPARLHHPFVGVRPADDLDDVESLGLAIGREFLKPFPGHPFAEVLPPRVAEPQERGAVDVLEVAMVFRDSKRAVPVQRVRPGVGGDLDPACDTVQARVISGTADAPPAVNTNDR